MHSTSKYDGRGAGFGAHERIAMRLNEGRREQKEVNHRDEAEARRIMERGHTIEAMCVVCHNPLARLRSDGKRKRPGLTCGSNCHYYWQRKLKHGAPLWHEYQAMRDLNAERRAMLALAVRLAPYAAGAAAGAPLAILPTTRITTNGARIHAV